MLPPGATLLSVACFGPLGPSLTYMQFISQAGDAGGTERPLVGGGWLSWRGARGGRELEDVWSFPGPLPFSLPEPPALPLSLLS